MPLIFFCTAYKKHVGVILAMRGFATGKRSRGYLIFLLLRAIFNGRSNKIK